MNDINVALRLRLKNDLSREAEKVERDLKQIGNAARSLGKGAGADKLGKDIADVSREAGRGTRAVGNLDREVRKLNNIKTDAAEREIKQIGQAAKQAERDLQALNRASRNKRGNNGQELERLDRPAGALNNTMGLLKASAGGAFAAIGAFAAVDNIVRGMERLGDQAKKLDRDVASVAVTAEMRTPEAVHKIGESNTRLSMRYGIGQSQVNQARKTYAAAGFGIDQQEAILDPTLKAAKAGDNVSGETVAGAVIATQQNLKVQDREVPLVLDMLVKGSKRGSFELGAMAKEFPSLSTQYARTGRKGPQGVAELVALAEIAREGAGSPEETATNLRGLLSKLFSEDSVRNFAEKGVDLGKLRDKAEATNTSYTTAVIDEVLRLTGGDQLKVNELFSDQEAGLALAPLMKNRAKYDAWVKEFLNDSQGTVDADSEFTQDTPQEKSERRDAAMEATGHKIGRTYNAAVDPLAEWFARKMNHDYAVQEQARDRAQYFKNLDLNDIRGKIANQEKQLNFYPKPKDGDRDLNSVSRHVVASQIKQLRDLLETGERIQGKGGVKQNLDADLSGAAQSSMQGYNSTLSAEGDKAIEIAREKAAAIRDSFNFTATPTIAPTFMPPVPIGSPTRAASPDKHSALPTSSNVKVAQYFPGGNARLMAMRAQREQNRAIRMAQARSLSDTGGKLA